MSPYALSDSESPGLVVKVSNASLSFKEIAVINPGASPAHQQTPEVDPMSTTDATELQGLVKLWRRRAEMHAATTMTLISLARMSRLNALQMRNEKTKWERRCAELEHELRESTRGVSIGSYGSPASSPRDASVFTPHTSPGALSEDWMSPPAGKPIQLPPLPHSSPFSHAGSYSPPLLYATPVLQSRGGLAIPAPDTEPHIWAGYPRERQSSEAVSEVWEPPRKRVKTEQVELALSVGHSDSRSSRDAVPRHVSGAMSGEVSKDSERRYWVLS